MMKRLAIPTALCHRRARAHADDIEIRRGGTLLRLEGEREVHVLWVVLCSTPEREAEARASAADFLDGRPPHGS